MKMPEDLGIKLLAMAMSIGWGFAEQAFAISNRSRNPGQSQERDKGSFLWISVSVSVGMTIACTFALLGLGSFRRARLWELAGFLLLLLGAGIRLHAIRVLGRQFTSRVTILEDHALVRDGIYRTIRHPSYLGQILILVGLGALMANGISLVAAPLFTTVALLGRIRVEERSLAERFGQAYEDYRRSSWRLLPLVW